MLACSTIPELDEIQYPVLATPKLDGIRCLMVDGIAMSRSMKPIPNKFVQEQLKGLHGFDGELMIEGDFNSVQSAIMSEHGEPDFTYNVFDYWDSDKGYLARYILLTLTNKRLKLLSLKQIDDRDELQEYYSECLAKGYEGSIIRALHGPYKNGRSTLKQGWMLKLKPFEDCEAELIGMQELEHNLNEAFKGELGQTKRTSHQANKVGGNKLGALITKFKDIPLNIGTGFTDAQRQEIWDNREKYEGKLVKFKHLGLSKYGVPRCPVFLGFRDKADT